MKYRKINCYNIIYFTLIFFILSSCNKKDIVIEKYQFPFKVGNEWTYIRIQNIDNVIPNHDSIISIHDTVITKEIKITLFDYTSANDNIDCIQLQAKYSTSSYNEMNYNYYKVLDDGLYRSYDVNGGLQAMSLFSCRNDYYFCGGLFNQKITTLLEFKEQILKYPIEVGIEWICAPSGDLLKKVTGNETIQFKGQSYSCYKIEYSYNSDTIASTIDYISDIGLIKRTRFIPNINIDGKGKGDYYETFDLIDLSLN